MIQEWHLLSKSAFYELVNLACKLAKVMIPGLATGDLLQQEFQGVTIEKEDRIREPIILPLGVQDRIHQNAGGIEVLLREVVSRRHPASNEEPFRLAPCVLPLQIVSRFPEKRPFHALRLHPLAPRQPTSMPGLGGYARA